MEPMVPMHTEADRRTVERRAAEIVAYRSFNPRAFLDMASRMDPPHGDRAAYWHAISEYIGKLEKLARVRGPHSPKLK